MPESRREELIDRALNALIAIMRRHDTQRCGEPELLRFALAFLYDGGDRESFTTFWREAMRDNSGDILAGRFGRFQTMRGAYADIARRNGRDYW